MTPPMTTTDSPAVDLEEKIARLIDPSSWSVFDGYLSDVKRKYRGEDAAYDPDAFKDKASMAKAREILALIAQARALPREGDLGAAVQRLTDLARDCDAALSVIGHASARRDIEKDRLAISTVLSALPPPGEVELREALERAATSLRTQGVGYTLDGNALRVLVHGFGRIDFGPVILAALTTRRAQTEDNTERMQAYLVEVAKEFGGKLPGDAWHLHMLEGRSPAEAAARHRAQTEGK